MSDPVNNNMPLPPPRSILAPPPAKPAEPAAAGAPAQPASPPVVAQPITTFAEFVNSRLGAAKFVNDADLAIDAGITLTDDLDFAEAKKLAEKYKFTLTEEAFNLMAEGGKAGGVTTSDKKVSLQDLKDFFALVDKIAKSTGIDSSKVAGKYLAAKGFSIVDSDQAATAFLNKYGKAGDTEITHKDLMLHISDGLKTSVNSRLALILGLQNVSLLTDVTKISKAQLSQLFLGYGFSALTEKPNELDPSLPADFAVKEPTTNNLLARMTKDTTDAVKEDAPKKADGANGKEPKDGEPLITLSGDKALGTAQQYLGDKARMYIKSMPERVVAAYKQVLDNGEFEQEEISQGKTILVKFKVNLSADGKKVLAEDLANIKAAVVKQTVDSFAEEPTGSAKLAKLFKALDQVDTYVEEPKREKVRQEIFVKMMGIIADWSSSPSPTTDADKSSLGKIVKMMDDPKLMKAFVEDKKSGINSPGDTGKDDMRTISEEEGTANVALEYKQRIDSIKSNKKYDFATAMLPGTKTSKASNGWLDAAVEGSKKLALPPGAKPSSKPTGKKGQGSASGTSSKTTAGSAAAKRATTY